MRSRLVYILSFWLLGAVVSSVVAMGGLTAWNLRQGFSAYLQARDLERLDKFVALAAQRLGAADVSNGAEPPRPDLPSLLRELAVLEGVAVGDLPSPPGGRGTFGPPGPPHGIAPGPGPGPGPGPPALDLDLDLAPDPWPRPRPRCRGPIRRSRVPRQAGRSALGRTAGCRQRIGLDRTADPGWG